MSRLDVVGADIPPDIVDRLLYRNARRILDRHVVRLDGTCHWCGRRSPCSARELAERAEVVSRQPWQESWTARNEITRLLPMLGLDLASRDGRGRAIYRRNTRAF